MPSTNRTNRVAVTDIEAAESTLTDTEAQDVSGGYATPFQAFARKAGGPLLKAFGWGFAVGTAIDHMFGFAFNREKVSDAIGDGLAK